MGNVYRSNYNGLQVTLNARNYHGLSMVAGYTYSHALGRCGRELGLRLRVGPAAERAQPRGRVCQQRLSTCATG
jgi:hypothetical protein